MSREISAARAARIMGVDPKTAVAWAQRAIAGDPAPIQYARRTVAGRYFLDAAEVRLCAPGECSIRIAANDADPATQF